MEESKPQIKPQTNASSLQGKSGLRSELKKQEKANVVGSFTIKTRVEMAQPEQ